jgi:hypothetical protein
VARLILASLYVVAFALVASLVTIGLVGAPPANGLNWMSLAGAIALFYALVAVILLLFTHLGNAVPRGDPFRQLDDFTISQASNHLNGTLAAMLFKGPTSRQHATVAAAALAVLDRAETFELQGGDQVDRLISGHLATMGAKMTKILTQIEGVDGQADTPLGRDLLDDAARVVVRQGDGLKSLVKAQRARDNARLFGNETSRAAAMKIVLDSLG